MNIASTLHQPSPLPTSTRHRFFFFLNNFIFVNKFSLININNRAMGEERLVGLADRGKRPFIEVLMGRLVCLFWSTGYWVYLVWFDSTFVLLGQARLFGFIFQE